MLFFDGAIGLVLFGLWVFCLIDVVTTPEQDCRNLPKLVWLLVVLLFLDVGSILWLLAGRNWDRQRAALQHRAPDHAGRDGRPRAAAPRRPANPDDDEEFQAELRARIEEQRRRAREARPGDDAPPPA